MKYACLTLVMLLSVSYASAQDGISRSYEPQHIDGYQTRFESMMPSSASLPPIDHRKSSKATPRPKVDEATRYYQPPAPSAFVQQWPKSNFLSPPFCVGGGNCVFFRDAAVELRQSADGKIKAFVYDKGVQKSIHKGVGLRAQVNIPGAIGGQLSFRWDPAQNAFISFLTRNQRAIHGSTIKLSLSRHGKVQRVTSPLAIFTHPRRGGTVMAAGPYAFEVVLYEEGKIEAYPTSTYEKTRTGDLSLRLAVLSKVGKVVSVPLRYVPVQYRFVGHTVALERLASGPLHLKIKFAGKTHYGSTTATKPLPPKELGGSQIMAGPYSVEVVRAGKNRLLALVRNAGNFALTARSADLMVNLHTSLVDEQDRAVDMPMRWNAKALCFEGIIPSQVRDFAWMSVTVRPLFEQEPSLRLGWNGATAH